MWVREDPVDAVDGVTLWMLWMGSPCGPGSAGALVSADRSCWVRGMWSWGKGGVDVFVNLVVING